MLGVEYPDMLASIANLPSTYSNQRRWKEAEELHVQVIETRKRVLGAEHPDTLASMANLAQIYHSQNQGRLALVLMADVVRLRSERIGVYHPDTVYAVDTLREWAEDDKDSGMGGEVSS